MALMCHWDAAAVRAWPVLISDNLADILRLATTTYAETETEDHTGRFFDECCVLGPGLRAEQTSLLYTAYKR